MLVCGLGLKAGMCMCVTGHHPGLQGPIPQKPWPSDPRSLELLAKPRGQEGLVGDTAPCNPETCRQDPESGWRRSWAQDQLPTASGGGGRERERLSVHSLSWLLGGPQEAVGPACVTAGQPRKPAQEPAPRTT